MDINRLSLLKEYIKGNYAPVITDDKYVEFIPNHSSINSNNLDAELTIKSDDSNIAQEPEWLTKANQEKILVIRNIDLIEKDEQKKIN